MCLPPRDPRQACRSDPPQVRRAKRRASAADRRRRFPASTGITPSCNPTRRTECRGSPEHRASSRAGSTPREGALLLLRRKTSRDVFGELNVLALLAEGQGELFVREGVDGVGAIRGSIDNLDVLRRPQSSAIDSTQLSHA